MAEKTKVRKKSGRRNPAGLLSFVSLCEKESSKEILITIFGYINSIFFMFGSPVVESFPIGIA